MKSRVITSGTTAMYTAIAMSLWRTIAMSAHTPPTTAHAIESAAPPGRIIQAN